jgi:hypothetical protein
MLDIFQAVNDFSWKKLYSEGRVFRVRAGGRGGEAVGAYKGNKVFIPKVLVLLTVGVIQCIGQGVHRDLDDLAVGLASMICADRRHVSQGEDRSGPEFSDRRA